VGGTLRRPVVAAAAPPGGGFAAPQPLDGYGAAADAVVAPDGRALVVWSHSDGPLVEDATQVLAAARPAGATAFGPAEAVSAPAAEAYFPDAAFDGATGRFAVAWSEYTPPETGYIVRAAWRSDG
jgi:hypothetical protein